MRRPVVAVLVAAIVGVAGFGAWTNRQPEPSQRFCRPDGECGLPGPDDRMPGELATPPRR